MPDAIPIFAARCTFLILSVGISAPSFGESESAGSSSAAESSSNINDAEDAQPELAAIPVEPMAPEAPADSARPDDNIGIEEIIITANKRAEDARTIAGAVTAISRQILDQTGSSNFGEYLSLSPGVNFDSGVPGYSVITIRGVSSDTVPGTAQTAVGIYYDDIALTDPAAPIAVPDIDAFDAARVELLRGPQGALYGSASLGGAVNYIPEAPDLGATQFSAQAGGNLATNSSVGGSGKFMFNLPLFDNGMALRAVGYYTRTPGYIDNVGTDTEQANSSRTGGGRVIAGFEPTADSTLRLTGLYQRTEVDDAGYVNESLGDLKKSTVKPEPSSNQIALGALRYGLNTDYGSWAFVAGYQDKEGKLSYDGATALGLGSTGLDVILEQDGTVKGYSAELRFVSPDGEALTWLAGLSYANRDEDFGLLLNAGDLADATSTASSVFSALGLSLPPGVLSTATLFQQEAKINAPELAAFADATYHFTPALKLSAGGRFYRNTIDSHVVANGVLVLPSGSTQSVIDKREVATGFNPKISLSYQIDPDLLVYGLYSRGYRLGGPNLVPNSVLTPTAPTYGPDKVDNYEIGVKTSWLDNRLTVDVSAFDIEWNQIPLLVADRTGVFKYLVNAGDARIRGVETALALRPFSFLTARSSVTYLDARLLNDFDPRNNRPPAEAGDRLPGSPAWTVTNTLTGQWAWESLAPTLTFIHRYEGPSPSNLSFTEVPKGDFNLFDLRAGFRLGDIGIAAFCKNLTDERAISASNNYAQPGGDVLSLKFLAPPRTFGLELSYSFEQ